MAGCCHQSVRHVVATRWQCEHDRRNQVPPSLTFAVIVCQGLVDKLRPLLKEGTQLKLLGVVGLDAVVRDARASVEVHTGVDVHEGGSLGHVEDVRHPEFLQAHCILGDEPGDGRRTNVLSCRINSFKPFRRTSTCREQATGRTRTCKGKNTSFLTTVEKKVNFICTD